MKLVLNKKDFINALKIAIITAAKKDIRYYLKGVFIEAQAGNVVNIVSTNGHAITRVTLDAPVVDAHSYIILRDDVECLIKSTKIAKNGAPGEITDMIELEHVEGEMQGSVRSPSTVIVRDGGSMVTCRLSDGVFPDYRRGIPARTVPVEAIGVNPEYVSNAVKALKVVADKNTNMRIEFDGATGLIKVSPLSFHSAAQMTDVLIGIMPVRV